jgi:ribosomal protein L7/L12
MDQFARAQIEALELRVAALERQLLGQEGAAAARPPDASADPEIVSLLQDGKKIQAIKSYREKTGADLSAAKAAVERVEAQLGL